MITKKNKNYGKKDILTDEDFDPKKIGHRISIVIPEDVLMGFRELAKEKGLGYQTLINQILRKEWEGKQSKGGSLENRLAKLEKALMQLKHKAA